MVALAGVPHGTGAMARGAEAKSTTTSLLMGVATDAHHERNNAPRDGEADLPTVVASEVMSRVPYKKFKPKTRKPQGMEKVVLDAIERVRRTGVAAEELVEGWTIKLLAEDDDGATSGIPKMDLELTAPDGVQMSTVMDVKRKFGMVIKEAAEARAESKALRASASRDIEASFTGPSHPAAGQLLDHGFLL